MNNSQSRSKLDNFLDKINTPFVQRVGNMLINKRYLYPSALLPMGIILIVFICLGIYPFGNKSILTLDMNGQYVYFFEQFRDILTGEQSLFYTFERSLGGEFFGYYTYYLASPLSLLVVLFPEKMITEAIAFIMILKSGLAGLSFSVYLDRTRKRDMYGFTMFSVMYALCSYATVFQSNIMWMDALIWLPLVALGIEKLVSEGKFKLFTIALAMTVWSNYYIGYMTCIFVVLYFFFYISAHENDEINKLGETRHRLKSLGRIALFSIIAVMISATVIFTAYYSLQFGKSDLQDNSFTPDLRFDILDLISKLFIGSFDTIRGEGLPNLYAGTFMLIMLPLYFLSKKCKGREKVCYIILCSVFVFSFSLNTLDLVWHGFQMPIWLNYRYSFMLSFIMLTMAYKGYESLEDTSTKTIGKICGVLAILAVLIQKLVYLPSYKGGSLNYTARHFSLVWLSLLCLIIYLAVLYFKKHSKLKETMATVLVLCVCVEGFGSSLLNWVGEISDAGWASRENYRSYVDRLEEVTDEIYENDKTFFRMEKTLFRKPNDALSVNINGISEFTSTFNRSTMNFLKKLGVVASSQTTKFYSGNEIHDSILGIKYMIGSPDTYEDGTLKQSVSSTYKPTVAPNGLIVYENPYYLPIAYGVESSFKSFDMSKEYNSPLEYTDRFLGAMIGEETAGVFESCIYDVISFNNCREVFGDGYVHYLRSNDNMSASFTFEVEAVRDGSIYMFLPTQFSTAADCNVDGNSYGVLFQHDSYRTFNIGTYKKGDIARVTLSYDAYRIFLYTGYSFFVQVNEDKLADITGELKANGLNVEKFSSTLFKGTLNLDEGKTVFTTIPYDKNWRVYVDGKRVETYKAADAMLAFDADSGAHTVKMKFVPMEFYAGVTVGVLGLGLFVTMCVLEKKYKKRKTVISQENI